MLLLNLLVLLDTVLKVFLQVLLDHLQCVFIFVALKCFSLLFQQLSLDLPDLILLALDVCARNLVVNHYKLLLLQLKGNLYLLGRALTPYPLLQSLLRLGVVLLFLGLGLFEVFVVDRFFRGLERGLVC